jgi:iron complex outermembrane receptor protein
LLSVQASAQHVVEEVIVTGTPGSRSTNELAQSVTVVGGPELDRVRAANLGETLESQLGMSASYFGAGASRPIIRGLAGARVRTLEDGIEAMDASTLSADHAVGIDPLVARQIEIFRGPTTLLYGSGAVAGVVNTVTNRIPAAAPADGLDARFEVRGDTVAETRALAAAIDGGPGRFAWHVDAAEREAGDYDIPGLADADDPGSARGRLANSDLELGSYAVGGSWFGNAAMLGLAVSGFDATYGIPGHGDDHELIRIDLEQTRVDLQSRLTLDTAMADAIEFRLGASDYEHVELEGGLAGTRFENQGYEGRLELQHSPGSRWRGALGLQFAEREFSALGEEAFVPPVDSQSAGLFVLEQLEMPDGQLALGARLERQRHQPAVGRDYEDTAGGFSAAAIRTLANDSALAFNFATADRTPAPEELYSNGPHLATESIEYGNPALGIETARHFDLGVRRAAGMLRWNVTAFVTDYRDFIYLQPTGAINPAEGLPEFVFLQQDAEFRGLEAELFAPIAVPGAGEIDLRVFGDLVRAELADGRAVPRIPPRRLGARLSWHSDRLLVGLEAVRHDAQQRTAPFETPTPGYTLLSADFDWLIALGNGATLTLFARASNLLDEEARRHTSLVKEIAPLPGRNLAFGLRAEF